MLPMKVADTRSEPLAQVVVYSTLLCPYCHRAKALLRKKGVEFTEIDVSMNAQKRAEMQDRSHGRHTVPQIFVGETHVGGCDDLYALDGEGGLDLLLESVRG